MKRSKTIKSIFALILCMVVTVAGIGSSADTAFAAGKKVPLKIGFQGKTVSLIKDLNTSSGRGDTPKLSSIQKKWGKPGKKTSDGVTTYTWKKGKTSIDITDYDAGKDEVGGIEISIEDKNGSLAGVKVGMKKAAALKKLQKQFGKKLVVAAKEGQEIEMKKDGSYTATGKAVSDDEHISVFVGPYMPINISLKDGKVSSIYWWRS